MFVHDVSDAFLSFARTYADQKYKSKYVTPILFLIVLSIWIYTRLFAYPVCCVYEAIN